MELDERFYFSSWVGDSKDPPFLLSSLMAGTYNNGALRYTGEKFNSWERNFPVFVSSFSCYKESELGT